MELINNSDLLPISSKLLDGEIGMNPDNAAALLNMSHCCRREAPEILTSSVITQLQEMASSSLTQSQRLLNTYTQSGKVPHFSNVTEQKLTNTRVN